MKTPIITISALIMSLALSGAAFAKNDKEKEHGRWCNFATRSRAGARALLKSEEQRETPLEFSRGWLASRSFGTHFGKRTRSM
mgnify:CR=1 FL=1